MPCLDLGLKNHIDPFFISVLFIVVVFYLKEDNEAMDLKGLICLI